jgi:hypothetical protein
MNFRQFLILAILAIALTYLLKVNYHTLDNLEELKIVQDKATASIPLPPSEEERKLTPEEERAEYDAWRRLTHINIRGKDKVDVLRTMWEYQMPALFYFVHNVEYPTVFDSDKAEDAILNGYIDYFMGRGIKTDFTPDDCLNVNSYNRDMWPRSAFDKFERCRPEGEEDKEEIIEATEEKREEGETIVIDIDNGIQVTVVE